MKVSIEHTDWLLPDPMAPKFGQASYQYDDAAFLALNHRVTEASAP